MLFSYVMGVDDSILELEKENFKIEKSNNDFLVEFDETKCNIWEDYIKSKLNVDFWNEYLSDENDEVVFIFHLDNGFKKYVVKNFENDEVLALCEKLCNCKFGSIKQMLADNHFYKEKVFKNIK